VQHRRSQRSQEGIKGGALFLGGDRDDRHAKFSRGETSGGRAGRTDTTVRSGDREGKKQFLQKNGNVNQGE